MVYTNYLEACDKETGFLGRKDGPTTELRDLMRMLDIDPGTEVFGGDVSDPLMLEVGKYAEDRVIVYGSSIEQVGFFR